MSIEQTLGHFFKPEIQASARKLLSDEKVSVQLGSDTGILAYIRVTPPLKVRLSSKGIGSDTMTASCTCPAAKKSQFCKHIWAVLLAVEKEQPDFLFAKQRIEKAAAPLEGESNQATSRLRATEYRKAQYEKQKHRAKEFRRQRPKKSAPLDLSRLPDEVRGALEYFEKNGFPMPHGPSEEIVSEAKRKLSRVFHPDRGGSNEEMVELNRNCEILLR